MLGSTFGGLAKIALGNALTGQNWWNSLSSSLNDFKNNTVSGLFSDRLQPFIAGKEDAIAKARALQSTAQQVKENIYGSIPQEISGGVAKNIKVAHDTKEAEIAAKKTRFINRFGYYTPGLEKTAREDATNGVLDPLDYEALFGVRPPPGYNSKGDSVNPMKRKAANRKGHQGSKGTLEIKPSSFKIGG